MEEIISKSVEMEFDGLRMDQYLAETLDFSRSYVQKLIKNNKVKLNGNFEVKSKVPVHVGDVIQILVPPPEELEIKPENINLDILYEDEELLVVNKPKNMVVHPSAGHTDHTLVNALLYHCDGKLSGINGVMRPGIVHRIDKDTTGALLVCKTDRAHQSLAEQLSVHSITRKYNAIVYHNLPEDTGTIDYPIGRNPVQRKKMAVVRSADGKRAVTHYRVLDRLNHQFNHIECRLETGRTHQIRVHMSYIHHPILGDTIYGPQPPKRFASMLEGQTLHARVIGFQHPVSNQYIEIEAPLPPYFVEVLKSLEK
jgi:23S rRNA pseudouridine1911/1915/1917 synthase